MDVSVETHILSDNSNQSLSWERIISGNLREQVKPLLLGHRLLSQELQYYGTHQVPFVLKLKGAFVLETDGTEVNYTIYTVHQTRKA